MMCVQVGVGASVVLAHALEVSLSIKASVKLYSYSIFDSK